MAHPPQHEPAGTGREARKGALFGVSFGDLGWFASLLMGLGMGFAAFFAATFVGIIALLVYSSATHHPANFALSYRYGGLTAGTVVLLATWAYLGALWLERITRRS